MPAPHCRNAPAFTQPHSIRSQPSTPRAMLLQYDQRRLLPPAAGTAPATRHDALHAANHAAVQILARTRVAMCHAVGPSIAYGCVLGASRAARRDTNCPLAGVAERMALQVDPYPKVLLDHTTHIPAKAVQDHLSHGGGTAVLLANPCKDTHTTTLLRMGRAMPPPTQEQAHDLAGVANHGLLAIHDHLTRHLHLAAIPAVTRQKPPDPCTHHYLPHHNLHHPQLPPGKETNPAPARPPAQQH